MLAVASGCSIRIIAARNVANTLSESGDVFSRDDDPELIRAAVPFGLKTYESLLESVPTHEPLLLTTCRGYTQYAYAFLEGDAEALGEAEHHQQVKELRDRALNLYLRGRAFCLRAMDLRVPGSSQKVVQDPEAALAGFEKKDVALLYWTAASWGAAIALGIDRPELVIDFPSVRALADRAIELDDAWSRGALHELMISLDSLPEALGGNSERARQHFRKAVELQQGLSPGPYVALAAGVAVPAQNREEFVQLLNAALAIDPQKDPSNRLATLIAQRRARALLAQADQKFSH